MTIAVSSAYFNIVDVQLGTAPALIAPYIVNKIGTGLSKALLCTGEQLSAEKAKFYNLISEIVETTDEAHKLIAELAVVFTACGPRSVEAAKNLVCGVAGQQITEDIMFFTAKMLAMVTISDEARDGMICVQARTNKPWQEEPYNIKPLYGTEESK